MRTWPRVGGTCCTLISLLASSVTAWGASLFGEPRTYPVGTSPVGIVAGEFSGASGIDLATADEGNTVTILTNHGDGVFDRSGQIVINNRYTATGIVGGRLNADAIDDVAISADDGDSPDFSGAVVTYLSTSAFHYTSTAVTVGLFPTCIALGDMTGDGLADLASCGISAAGNGLISLLSRNVDGSFAPPIGLSLGTITPTGLVPANIDLDSKPDLLVLDAADNAVWILYGRGGPAFDSPVRLAGIDSPDGAIDSPTAAVVARFGSDTLPGIAVASRDHGQVLVFRQSSPRGFGAPAAYPVGLFPADLATQDFNKDTMKDLVSVNNGSSDVTLLLGTGDGTFQLGETVMVGDGPVAVVVDDFNGDGKPDFATADQDDQRFGPNTQSVSVVLNGVSPPLTPTPTSTATATPSATASPTLTRTPSRTRTPTRTPTPSRTPTFFSPTPTRTPAGPADFNCDGSVNEGDLKTVIDRIFDGTSGCINRPVTAADIPFIIKLLPTPH